MKCFALLITAQWRSLVHHLHPVANRNTVCNTFTFGIHIYIQKYTEVQSVIPSHLASTIAASASLCTEAEEECTKISVVQGTECYSWDPQMQPPLVVTWAALHWLENNALERSTL